MKVLWSWLLELCDLDRLPTVDEAARALTRGGLEIEGLSDLASGFSGVVVAEVVAKRPHPDASKLTLVDVITERGGAATQVVCGAPNVPEPGRKVLWAQIGATLPGGMTLAAKPVKGVVSPGMLCAEDELGLSTDHGGIIVLDADDHTALGAPAQRALGLADWLLEVNAPANRGDLLGHLGVARELVAVLGGKLVLPDCDVAAYASDTRPPRLAIDIIDDRACPRYLGRIIDGLTVAPSPRRIAQRLRNVGVRPISNLVDVTNYVLFELGQPLHAFDHATLTTPTVVISLARDGEKFVTLDGVERTLVAGDLLIRDGDRGIALAGVMGGLATEVTAKTTRVMLESASFHPTTIRRTARRLGLISEASHRFERGVDPELAPLASARAARLMCMLGGGRVVGEPVDSYPRPAPRMTIPLRLGRARMVTGVELSTDACHDALTRLDCAVTVHGDTLEVTPPSSRPDLTREIDLIEDVLRLTGYDQVTSTLPPLRSPHVAGGDSERAERVRDALAAAGGFEAITFAFQSRERIAALDLPANDPRTKPFELLKPMSIDQAVMRTSLLPNLIAAVARNHSHGRSDVVLFEVGHVFLRWDSAPVDDAPAHEPLWASGVLAGRRAARIGDGEPYDVFDAKALAMIAIRAALDAEVAIQTVAISDVPYLHPGVAGALMSASGGMLGRFGEVHPTTRERLGVHGKVFAFEVNLSMLPGQGRRQMHPIPRFPGSARDISLLVATDTPAARIEAAIAAAHEPLVVGVRLLEDYRDDAKLGAGHKSMLWSISYRAADRTLTDQEVDRAHEAIVERLVASVGAQRR